ncbi:MAG: DNA polymerase/3'-5' exonuclease PolX [Patescibacteria group bacterium]
MDNNHSVTKLLNEMAVFLAMEDIPFKPRAYEQAAHSIGILEEDVGDMYKKGGLKALEGIPGIGASIAEKIEEYLKHGRVHEYEALKKKFPIEIEGLLRIEGIGPKSILKLYQALHIRTVEELEKAARAGKLRDVPGLGPKTEENILRGIGFVRESGGRQILGFILPDIEKLRGMVAEFPGVEQVEIVGSPRRMQETIGDIDLLAFSKYPEKVLEHFTKLHDVQHVYSHGEHRALVRLRTGLDADLAVVNPESYGSAMIAWTGSKAHNIHLRTIAEKKGMLLNDYGLFKGKKLVASLKEEDIYDTLDLQFIPPELRNDMGELEAAAHGTLPRVIDYDDVKGDLQVQTDWTDGEHSIEEMAKAAKKLGLEYICITDHTKSLAMTGGSDEKKLLKQMAEIDEIQKRVSGITILKGAEVNILKDGSLDIDDETLAKLDVVGAAVHSLFSLSEKEQTARMVRAMENPNVDIIFHPTGRVIQKRPAYAVDVDELIKAAKRTKTVLEIDAYPSRLDLKDEYIRKAVDAGVRLSIDSDAHATSHFQFLRYGIGQARRGWATKSDVVNTRSVKEMLKLLK